MNAARKLWPLVIVALVLTAALGAAVFRVSLTTGRLSTFPRVDDVIYLASGARLSDAAAHGSKSEAMRRYIAEPPHSPWAAVSAFFAFGLVGTKDWAPYCVAALPAAAFLVFAGWMARGAGAAAAATVCVVVGAYPGLATMFQSLKPDQLAGMLTAIGIVCIVAARPLSWTCGYAVACGLPFGLALLAKPATFPQIGALLGAALLARLAIPIRPPRSLPRKRVAWCAMAVVAACAPAMPHYVVAWRRIVSYIREVEFGESGRVWNFGGSAWEHLDYYLGGPGGRLMLDRFAWVVAGGLVVGACVVLARGSRPRRAITVRLGLLLLLSYLIPTINPVKIAQFGSAFQALSMLAFAASAGAIARAAQALSRGSRIALAAGLLLAAWAPYRFTFPGSEMRGAAGPAALKERDAIVRTVWKTVATACGERGGCEVAICDATGDVCPELLEYWAIQQNMTGMRTLRVPAAAGSEDLRLLLRSCDIAITTDGLTGMTVAKRSVPGADAAMMGFLGADPEWMALSRTPGVRERGEFVVYRRVSGGSGPPR